MKRLFRKLLESYGYVIHKQDGYYDDSAAMTGSLRRLKNLGIEPDLIIDIGAAEGTWFSKAFQFWNSAEYELIEPLSEQEEKLKELKKLNPKVNYHLAVAGEQSGTITLNVSDDLDGSGIYDNPSTNDRKVPVIKIDDITKDNHSSVLIKFDTHGYELPILKGAKDSLAKTDVLIIEVYGFRISPTCLLFHEISQYLDENGFRLFDIVDTLRRTSDSAFWQADAIYLRKNHKVFENNNYN